MATRLKQRIRALDGTWRTIYSYDGISWGMDARRAQNRFKRGSQLRPKFGQKAKDRLTIGATEKEAPVFMPVTRIGGTFLGTANGKNQKYRRNLRRK